MIIKKLAVALEKYTDKNGQEKTKWATIGHVHEHNGKEHITLERTFNLSGVPPRRKQDGTVDYRVFVSMFDPENNQGQQQQRPQNNTRGGNEYDPDEDIPFSPMPYIG